MIFTKKVFVVKIEEKSGTGKKTGEPYTMITAHLFDDKEYESVKLNVSKDAINPAFVPHSQDALVDISVTPARQGYGFDVQVVAIRPVTK